MLRVSDQNMNCTGQYKMQIDLIDMRHLPHKDLVDSTQGRPLVQV